MVDVGSIPNPCADCGMKPIREDLQTITGAALYCAECYEKNGYDPSAPPSPRCTWCGGAKQRDRVNLPFCEMCERAREKRDTLQTLTVINRAEHEARECALHGFAAAALTLFGASAILITSDRQARAFANLAEPLLTNGVRLGLFTLAEADSFRLALNIERPEP